MTTAIVLLTKNQARKITARIQTATENLAALLLEAHDGEAWRAEGFDSWTSYVEARFTFGRSRSYQLLAVARVEQATGEQIPSRLAEQVVQHVGQIEAPSAVYIAALEEQRAVKVAFERGVAIPKEHGRSHGYQTPTEQWRKWGEALSDAADAKGDDPFSDPSARRVIEGIRDAAERLLRAENESREPTRIDEWAGA